ncbi:MAG: SufD family Fe-S cluster assembly protein, partial [Actinobacteria bacterium]|nr:SufD family Fe-S cluster assembly protein [Actinomycetota bacterium]
MSDTKRKAEEAKGKVARYGPDIDLGEYTVNAPSYPEQELGKIDVVDEERLLNAGVDLSGKERSGSFIQVDSSVL